MSKLINFTDPSTVLVAVGETNNGLNTLRIIQTNECNGVHGTLLNSIESKTIKNEVFLSFDNTKSIDELISSLNYIKSVINGIIPNDITSKKLYDIGDDCKILIDAGKYQTTQINKLAIKNLDDTSFSTFEEIREYIKNMQELNPYNKLDPEIESLIIWLERRQIVYDKLLNCTEGELIITRNDNYYKTVNRYLYKL